MAELTNIPKYEKEAVQFYYIFSFSVFFTLF
jgi:hypothetical protein